MVINDESQGQKPLQNRHSSSCMWDLRDTLSFQNTPNAAVLEEQQLIQQRSNHILRTGLTIKKIKGIVHLKLKMLSCPSIPVCFCCFFPECIFGHQYIIQWPSSAQQACFHCVLLILLCCALLDYCKYSFYHRVTINHVHEKRKHYNYIPSLMEYLYAEQKMQLLF